MKDKCYYIIPELATKEKLKYYNCDMYNINDNINDKDLIMVLIKENKEINR